MIIRDPVYGIIEVDDSLREIIDNPFFQRLKFIKQNAQLFQVFPSAKHDRFSHSLGAFHLMSLITDRLVADGSLSLSTARNLCLAALLHDVGHGPYSHLWERLIDGFDHEEFSKRIIVEVFNLPEVVEVMNGPYKLFLSSVLDVDKLDYMARDSYFCGVGYGITDLERIVKNLSVIDGKLVIPVKVLSSAEHVILSRISLFKSTYYHHFVRAVDALLLSIFKRVLFLLRSGSSLIIDPSLKNFLLGEQSLKDFLRVNDSLIEYHLALWLDSSDEVLSDLVKRFFSRKGFSAINPYYFGFSRDSLRELVAERFDINYYFFEDFFEKSIYESPLFVLFPDGSLKEIVEVSSLVKGVADNTITVDYVIGPKELFSPIKKNSLGSEVKDS